MFFRKIEELFSQIIEDKEFLKRWKFNLVFKKSVNYLGKEREFIILYSPIKYNACLIGVILSVIYSKIPDDNKQLNISVGRLRRNGTLIFIGEKPLTIKNVHILVNKILEKYGSNTV